MTGRWVWTDNPTAEDCDDDLCCNVAGCPDHDSSGRCRDCNAPNEYWCSCPDGYNPADEEADDTAPPAPLSTDTEATDA